MNKFKIEDFFTKEWEREIPEISMTAVMYIHKVTKAEVLHLKNKDTNKLFSVAFKTLPKDSTGVAHILEHSVLNGSEKYPIKEPLVELLKNSLNTFVNAMTWSDRTVFPVASENEQDLYNLSDVYLDSVFNPLLSKEVFMQEGWHYELRNLEDPVVYKGVVFNEMKGAVSNIDRIVEKELLEGLMPDTIYSNDFGGDPSKIPDLTYEEFVDFHKKYYHPSNARFLLYGDLEIERSLAHIQEYITDYKEEKVETINRQEKFKDVVTKEILFTADKNKPIKEQGIATCGWVFIDSVSQKDRLGLEILSYFLVNAEGSPLKKALLDSKLGQSVIEFGLDFECGHPTFIIGLKGIEIKNANKVENIISNVFESLGKGIDINALEGAINRVEFAKREESYGFSDSKPIEYLRTVMSAWTYDRDPLEGVYFAESFASIRQNLTNGYFEELIKKYFIDNTHRINLRFAPDSKLAEERENKEKGKLAQFKDSLSVEDQEKIIETTKKLDKMQKEENDPKELAKLPMLEVSDLEKDSRKFPVNVETTASGVEIVRNKYNTNNIVYLQFAFDISFVEAEFRPYINLFAEAIVKMGTKTKTFEQVHSLIDRYTGGVDYHSYSGNVHQQPDNIFEKLVLTVKVLDKNIDKALSVLEDMLLNVNLNQPERFKQIVLENLKQEEESMVENGHSYALMKARSSFSRLYLADELMEGSSGYAVIKEAVNNFDENWLRMFSILKELHGSIIKREKMVVNITSDEKKDIIVDIHRFLEKIPLGENRKEAKLIPVKQNTSVAIPAAVNFVAEVQSLTSSSFKMHGSYIAISNIIRLNYLWNEVRVKGGAYGAMHTLSPSQGLLSLVSYRDPNIKTTFDCYASLAKYLLNVSVSDREITGLIIGAIGQIDTYLTEEEKGNAGFDLYMRKVPDSYRQRMRNELFDLSNEDVKQFGEILSKVPKEDKVRVVFGNERKIKEYLVSDKSDMKIVDMEGNELE